MRILVWFRNDLRIRDNRVLAEAIADAEEVIPFYCFDRHYDKDLPEGFPRTGHYRRKFLEEALLALDTELKKLEADLIFRKNQGTAEAIAEIHREHPIDAIYYEELPFHEEQEIAQAVADLGLPIKSFWQSTLFELSALPFTGDEIPWIFTDFRKQVEKHCQVRDLIAPPERIVTTRVITSQLIKVISEGEEIERDQRAGIDYRGGEAESWQRLHQYFWEQDRLREYKETRNGMLGADYSSKFSAALAHGCLSPVQIYHEVKRYEREREKNSSTYWLIFELIWRDFFRFTAHAEGRSFFRVPRQGAFSWTEQHEQWRTGKTGQPLIDACMNELRNTGYLGNRGRQLVASYLINDMKQHWYPGARWFESVLTDYDAGSNYGNWTYLAGVGHDPRKDRYFNIEKQAERYDPEGRYCRAWGEGG